jgi:ribose 5-phosphate isomerase RpiB
MTDQKKINAMPEILAALIRIEAHAIVNRQANARILSILKETERDEEFAAMVKLYDEIRQQLSEYLESRAL